MSCIKLESVLSGITCTADYHTFTVPFCLIICIESEVCCRGKSENIQYSFLCIRTLNGELSPTVRLVDYFNVEFSCLLFDPCEVLVYIGCVHNEKEMLRLELSVNEEIIYDTTVRMAHHTIKNLTRLETTDLIGKYKVNECLSIWSTDENLTHVRNVEHTHIVADSVVLIHNVRILDRHIESCKRTHFGAKCHMTVM